MSIEALKEQARGHEQREEWTDALQLYLQAISRLGDEDPDMGLYNRAGDLFTRVGNVEGAIEYYEMAVDLYLDAELANNAIAILKKILRNVPDRKEVYLKMGQIRAQQGFLPDARGYFLGYAERTQKAGDLEEAFRALREFCDLAPDDLEIRTTLAAQLQVHERTDEAVSLLTSAYHRFNATGQRELAARVEEQIQDLDPEYEIPEASEEDILGFESTSLVVAVPEEAADGSIELAADFGEISYSDPDDAQVTPSAGLELEHTSLAPETVSETAPPTDELTAADFGEADDGGRGLSDYVDPNADVDAEIEASLPEIELGDDDEIEVWGAASSWSDDDDEEDEVTELPLMNFGDSDEEVDEGGRWAEQTEFAAAEEIYDIDAEATDVADGGVDEPEMIGVPGVDAAPLPDAAYEAPAEAWSDGPADAEFETSGVFESADGEFAPVEAAPESFADERESAPRTDVEPTSFEFTTEGLDSDGYETISVEDADVLDSFDDAAFESAADDLWKQPDDVVVDPEPVWTPEHALEESLDSASGWSDRLADAMEDDAQAAFDPDEVEEEMIAAYEASDLAEEAPSEAGGFAPYSESEIGNREPREGFGGGATEAGEAPDSDASPEYVDLNTMVFGAPKERTTRWNVESEEPLKESDFDFQQMLAQFKEKVAENVEVGDVKAHYDLGTAFKEMGLLDEAIMEFQQALRADGRNLATYEVLGQCFMDKGQPEVAVRSLTMATSLPFEVEDELLGIYYYLGRAHEELGNSDHAVEFYEKVFALDINFQDVTERLRDLR